jgi:hypothetical protein
VTVAVCLEIAWNYFIFLWWDETVSTRYVCYYFAYCTSLKWWTITSLQQSVEWELSREPEVPGEDVPQFHTVYHKSHMTWPWIKLWPQQWEADHYPPELCMYLRVVKVFSFNVLTFHRWVYTPQWLLALMFCWELIITDKSGQEEICVTGTAVQLSRALIHAQVGLTSRPTTQYC